MKKFIKYLIIFFILGLFLITAFLYRHTHRNFYPEQTSEGLDVPVFSEVNLDFKHQHEREVSCPMTGGSMIDVDGDGIDEIFISGGFNQNDAFFAYRNEKFIDITEELDWKKTLNDTSSGAASIDATGDGKVDLFVARDSGLYLYTNTGNGFIEKKLDVIFRERDLPLSIALTDLNQDGWVDMYISAFVRLEFMEGLTVFNKENYGARSLLLLNNGDNSFRDITKAAGLEYLHNTFQAVFVDVDRDLDPDLIVAHDTGTIRTYRNKGDMTFEMVSNSSTDYFSYPMGIAVGDYTNDGLIDFAFSNVGNTMPESLIRGDLRNDQVLHTKWMLFENTGDVTFKDSAVQAKIADYEFSWGAVFADLNLDGYQDLVVSENYIDIPFQFTKLFRNSGRVLLQKTNHTFVAVEQESGLKDTYFGNTPLLSDFNQDGYLDIIWINLDGPARAFISSGGENHYLQVNLGDNPESLGALVTILMKDGRKLVDVVAVGEGLLADQTHILTFGLGNQNSVESLRVQYMNGEEEERKNPEVDSIISIRK